MAVQIITNKIIKKFDLDDPNFKPPAPINLAEGISNKPVSP